MRKALQTTQGFTLVELVVGMGIFTLLLGAIVTFSQFTLTSQFQLTNTYQGVDEAETNIQKMMKELREAKAGDDGSFAFALTNDSELVFFSDSDNDGTTERIHYFLSGANLQRGVTKPTGTPLIYDTDNEIVSTVATHITNGATPIFYYYNKDWPQDTTNNPLTQDNRLANATLLKIRLTINVDTKHPEQTYTLENYAQVRNLKTNL